MFLGRILLIIIQFASLLITNRLLGADGRGLFASAGTWSLFLFTVFYLSINVMYIKECADKKIERTDLKNGFFSFAILLSVVSIAVALLLYLFLNKGFIKLPWQIYVINILTIPFMIIQSLSVSVYQSENDFKKVNIIILFTAACSFLFIIISTFFLHFNVTVISVISLASWFLCSLYCYITCHFSFSLRALKTIFYRKFMVDLGFLHTNTIMTFLVSGFNILLMHKYISDSEVGQYFLANTITGYLLILPISIQNVLIADIIHKSHLEKVRATLNFFKAALLGMLVILVPIYFFSDLIIRLLGGKTFIHSAFYLQCLLVTVAFQVAGIIWSSLWNIRGYFKLITKVSFIVVAMSVILNFILIKSMGVEGAIITTLLITFLSMCVHIFLAIKECKKTGIPLLEFIPQKKDYLYLVHNLSILRSKFQKKVPAEI